MSKFEENCQRCGHSSKYHRLDDAKNLGPVDPGAKFRCIIEECGCPDFEWLKITVRK